jgi:C-terminal processing protease CtpA/Prc
MPPEEQGTVLVALEKGPSGPVVYTVAQGSQAERAGIRTEDVIESVDDVKPHDLKDARALLSGLPGSDLRIVVSRKGTRFEVVTSREGFLRQ